MNRVETPQSRCRAAFARCDITPPVGIYHRMWGAALHDRATGVHRPLEAGLLWLEPRGAGAGAGSPQVFVSLDHCILDAAEIRTIRSRIAGATGISADHVLVTLSHTHGSGWMSRTRSHLPGGDLIGPYFDQIVERVVGLAREARSRVADATIVYGIGTCSMAAHRDFLDVDTGKVVCGFNPAGPADDTLLIARITADEGASDPPLATIVNYACHPTTLAWENTLISPDWIGAMRETVEQQSGSPCLFLQGASGDLGPREGFVGDPAVADRNGREVGYAALATLCSLPAAGTEFRYAGPVISGAVLGTWRHELVSPEARDRHAAWRWTTSVVDLPYRSDLPTIEQTTRERDQWLSEEALAREAGNEARVRDCRAQVEQRTRQLARLAALAPGAAYPLEVRVGIVGDAIWVFTPGELYQVFQLELRRRFARRPVVVTTLTNDWQPGYVPPADTFGRGIYQEIIAATAPGSLEALTDSVARTIEELLLQQPG